MVLILDGYNILKQMSDKDLDRTRFISMVENYAFIKKLKIMMVFDSGPFNYKITELYGNLSVIYVGQGYTADEYISTYCANHTREQLVVVSSDRGIIQAVTGGNTSTISAQEFISLMQEALSTKRTEQGSDTTIQISKLTSEQDELADELMQYGAKLPFKKDEEKKNAVRSPKRQLSKKEKKKDQLLKKL